MGRTIEIVSAEFLVYFQMSFYLITTAEGNADTHFYPYCANANILKNLHLVNFILGIYAPISS